MKYTGFSKLSPTAKYQKVWNGKESNLICYLSFPLVEFLEKDLSIDDRDLIHNTIASIFKETEETLLRESRFDAVKKSLNLIKEKHEVEEVQQKRIKLPNYAVQRNQFDEEVNSEVRKKLTILIKKLEKEYEYFGHEYPLFKGYLIRIIRYFEVQALDLVAKVFKSSKPQYNVSIVDKVINKLGSSNITQQEINEFSDYFTSLPVKKGLEMRKKIGSQILKLPFSDKYKEGLRVEDRFGNTLFSMALSTIAEADRPKYYAMEVLVPKDENQKILWEKQQKAGKIGTLKFRLNLEIQKIKNKTYSIFKKKCGKETDAESKIQPQPNDRMNSTPICQYLQDPSRKLLREQLKFEDPSVVFVSRYPNDSTQQTSHYKKLKEIIGTEYLGDFFYYIFENEVDFTNLQWLSEFDMNPFLEMRGSFMAKSISIRLKMNTMSPTLFRAIKEKLFRLRQKGEENSPPLSTFIDSIKGLFTLSFQAFNIISTVMEQDWFKYVPKSEVIDKNSEERPISFIYNDMVRFIKEQLPHQLLFYSIFYKDQTTVDKLNETFEYFLQVASDHPTVQGLREQLTLHAACELAELSGDLATSGLDSAAISALLRRSLALKAGFQPTKAAAGFSAALLADRFLPYPDTNLAELAFGGFVKDANIAGAEYHMSGEHANVLAKAARLDPHNPRPAIGTYLQLASSAKFRQACAAARLALGRLWLQLLARNGSGAVYTPLSDLPTVLSSENRRKTKIGKIDVIVEKKLSVNVGRYKKSFDLWKIRNKENLINRRNINENDLQSYRENKFYGELDKHHFCRHALEVLAVHFTDEQAASGSARACLGGLARAFGLRLFLKAVFRFAAANCEVGGRAAALCAYLANDFLVKLFPNGSNGGCDVAFLLGDDQNEGFGIEQNTTSLVYNRFIRTAIDKDWIYKEKISEMRLLDPVLLEVQDPKHLSEEKKLTLLLLGETSDFGQIAFSPAFTDDEKLSIMKLEYSIEDLGLRAELLKLLKIPGMTLHGLHYAAWVHRLDLTQVCNDSLESVVNTLNRLNDLDFAKAAAHCWQTFAKQNNEAGQRSVLLAGLASRSLPKLAAAVKLADPALLGAAALDRPFDGDAFALDFDGALFSPALGIISKWGELAHLLAAQILMKNTESAFLFKEPEKKIENAVLAQIVKTQCYFDHSILGIRYQFETALRLAKEGKNSALLTDIESSLKSLMDVFARGAGQVAEVEAEPGLGLLAGRLLFVPGPDAHDWKNERGKKRFAARGDLFEVRSAPDMADLLKRDFKRNLKRRTNQKLVKFSSEIQDASTFRDQFSDRLIWAISIFFELKKTFLEIKNKEELLLEILKPELSFHETLKGTKERAVVDLMGSMSFSVFEISKLARSIKEPDRFIQEMCIEIGEIKKSLDENPDYLDHEAEQEEEYQEMHVNQRKAQDRSIIMKNYFNNLMMIAPLMVCFFSNAKLADTLISKLKELKIDSNLIYCNRAKLNDEQVALERNCYNKEAFNKIVAFSVKVETPIPQNTMVVQDPNLLGYLEVMDMVRVNEQNIAADHSLLSKRDFRLEHVEKGRFSAALVKQMFADQGLAITKLSKAAVAWSRAVEDTAHLPPLAAYQPQSPAAPEPKDKDIVLPFNPFAAPSPRATICTKDEAPALAKDCQIEEFVFPVWFDVVEQKSDKPKEASSYFVKVNYQLYYKTKEGQLFFFDPKARMHSSQFDLFTLIANMKDKVEPVEKKLGSKLVDKFNHSNQGPFAGGVHQVSDPADKNFWSTNFGENLIGLNHHNEKFYKNRRVLQQLNSIYEESRSKATTNNIPPSVSGQVNSVMGVSENAVKNPQLNSQLGLWAEKIF